MGFEQRRSKRVKVALHGELIFSKNGLKRVLACKTLNLSETGVAVTSWGHADIGDSAEVRILMPNNNLGLRFSAVVVSIAPAEDQPSYDERRRQAMARQVNDIRLAFTAMDEENHQGLLTLLEKDLGKGGLKPAMADKPAPSPAPLAQAHRASPDPASLAKPLFIVIGEQETRGLLQAKPHLILDQMRQWPQFQPLMQAVDQSLSAKPLAFEHSQALPFNHPLQVALGLPGTAAKADFLAAVDACQPVPGSTHWRVHARLLAIEQEAALRLSAQLASPE